MPPTPCKKGQSKVSATCVLRTRLEGVLADQPLPPISYCCTQPTAHRGVAILLLVICKNWHLKHSKIFFFKSDFKNPLAQYKCIWLQAKFSVSEDSDKVADGEIVCVCVCVCVCVKTEEEKK